MIHLSRHSPTHLSRVNDQQEASGSVTATKSLADYVELASQKHNGASGRQLAAIAEKDGFDVSRSTLNRIRKGNYASIPTTATLQAIAHLARVSEAEVFSAAIYDDDDSDWPELEKAFEDWYEARARILAITTRYARLRGVAIAEASRELNQMAAQYEDAMAGRSGWYPPWDSDPDPDEGTAPAGPRFDIAHMPPDENPDVIAASSDDSEVGPVSDPIGDEIAASANPQVNDRDDRGKQSS